MQNNKNICYYIKTKYFNKIKTMHIHNMNARK